MTSWNSFNLEVSSEAASPHEVFMLSRYLKISSSQNLDLFINLQMVAWWLYWNIYMSQRVTNRLCSKELNIGKAKSKHVIIVNIKCIIQLFKRCSSSLDVEIKAMHAWWWIVVAPFLTLFFHSFFVVLSSSLEFGGKSRSKAAVGPRAMDGWTQSAVIRGDRSILFAPSAAESPACAPTVCHPSSRPKIWNLFSTSVTYSQVHVRAYPLLALAILSA
jgi:hypothetical protein